MTRTLNSLSTPRIFLGWAIGMVIILLNGCATSYQMERSFFDKAYDQDGARFSEYSIPNQIKIYLYGVQSINPPVPVLSRPIAEQGQAAVPHILAVLNENPTDQNIKDLMVIFETMQRLATYNVSHDKRLLRTLDGYVGGMKNEIWRGNTKYKLDQIKQSNQDEDVLN